MRVPFTGSIMIAWLPPIDDLSTPGGEVRRWPKAISRQLASNHGSRNFVLEQDARTAHSK